MSLTLKQDLQEASPKGPHVCVYGDCVDGKVIAGKGKGRKSLKERGFKTHTKSCLYSQHWPDTGLVKKKNIINVYQYNVSPQCNVSV